MQCIQELLASRADYRNYETFVYRNCILNAHKNCWHLQINCKADYRNYQTFVYRKCTLNVYRNCWHCKQQNWIQELPHIYIPQLHTQCIQELLAFANSKAECRNCPTFVDRNCTLNVNKNCGHLQTAGLNKGIASHLYTASAHSMVTRIAGICKQQGRI